MAPAGIGTRTSGRGRLCRAAGFFSVLSDTDSTLRFIGPTTTRAFTGEDTGVDIIRWSGPRRFIASPADSGLADSCAEGSTAADATNPTFALKRHFHRWCGRIAFAF